MNREDELWNELCRLPWPQWSQWALHCDCRGGGHWYVSFNGSLFTGEYPTRAGALEAALERARREQGAWHASPRRECVA